MNETTLYEDYRIKHLKSGKFTVWGPMGGPGLGDPNGTVYSGLKCSDPIDSLEEAKKFIDHLRRKR
jgi:hypothetical protein